jgi:tetratricopeptide (TPR) repeat protein
MRTYLVPRTLISGLLVILGCFLLAGNVAFAQAGAKDDYEKLKKEYDKVVADRDNILSQTKTLVEFKSKYTEAVEAAKKLGEEKNRLQRQVEVLNEQNALASQKTDAEASGYKQKIAELEGKQSQLVQEQDNLKSIIRKTEIEYKMLPETKREVSRLQDERKEIQRKFGQIESKLKRMDEQMIDKDAQVEVHRKQIKDLKRQLESAMAKNKQLEKQSEQMPSRFAEIARENKLLIKETALMHYNLGVFYTKNKEYSRAIAEFEKTIELDPQDAYAHYNAGLIYAENLVNRPKALEHFRKFLSLAKTDDKDTDWVKRYIITWQTWEGKKPME